MFFKPDIEHVICFVNANNTSMAKIKTSSFEKVKDSSWGTNQDIRLFNKLSDVDRNVKSSKNSNRPEIIFRMFETVHFISDLISQFSCRCKDDELDSLLLLEDPIFPHFFNDWDGESHCLA